MERISVFDIFKVGIGPSSSHTMGPWRAAQRFLHEIGRDGSFDHVEAVQVDLYGSLAKTGKGHGTDLAVILGLNGDDPVTYSRARRCSPPSNTSKILKPFAWPAKTTCPSTRSATSFSCTTKPCPTTPTALSFRAFFRNGAGISQTYLLRRRRLCGKTRRGKPGRHGYTALSHRPRRRPGPLVPGTKQNHRRDCVSERAHLAHADEIRPGLLDIWDVMRQCVYTGCHTDGVLPGGLEVGATRPRHQYQTARQPPYSNVDEWMHQIRGDNHAFRHILKWVSCFALAVNEENAAFGRVVTAPTNGAAGVIPAVMMYYACFCPEFRGDDDIVRFMLTAGEFGSLFKKGATISAAMGGCQAEIGVSSAMAAGALTECLGGNYEQAMMAAEIAMEHHLGMTCDPIGGLVQVPCIERNTMGAIKAITAAQIALESDPSKAKVSLDAVIKTMKETADDMHHKYKETADGGLAVQFSVGLVEC
jgi:L-serine dehydratase